MDFTPKKLVLNSFPAALLVFVLVAGLRLVQSEPLTNGASATPVAPQAMLVEAKSMPEKVDSGANGLDSERVWKDINSAISNLNDLVGAEMFLEVKRSQKGQMEVRLDKNFWDRVQYQTRVDLKTDISDLWHLYVTEYKHVDSSVVYFIDDNNGRVIDIFSKTN